MLLSNFFSSKHSRKNNFYLFKKKMWCRYKIEISFCYAAGRFVQCLPFQGWGSDGSVLSHFQFWKLNGRMGFGAIHKWRQILRGRGVCENLTLLNKISKFYSIKLWQGGSKILQKDLTSFMDGHLMELFCFSILGHLWWLFKVTGKDNAKF